MNAKLHSWEEISRGRFEHRHKCGRTLVELDEATESPQRKEAGICDVIEVVESTDTQLRREYKPNKEQLWRWLKRLAKQTKNLEEALRRIVEGAVMIRTKGEASVGYVIERHVRSILGDIRKLQSLDDDEVTTGKTIS
eukprot:Gb_02836 [translate_table: standard]